MILATGLRQAILEHASRSGEVECCGILLGTSSTIVQALPATNLLASPVAFLIDPADHFAARRLARQAALDVVGFYHSHPRSAPRPSPRDVAEAAYDEAVYLIVGLEAGQRTLRAFRIRQAKAEEIVLQDADQ